MREDVGRVVKFTHDEGTCVVCDEVRRGHLGHRSLLEKATVVRVGSTGPTRTRAVVGLLAAVLGIILALGFVLAVGSAIEAFR